MRRMSTTALRPAPTRVPLRLPILNIKFLRKLESGRLLPTGDCGTEQVGWAVRQIVARTGAGVNHSHNRAHIWQTIGYNNRTKPICGAYGVSQAIIGVITIEQDPSFFAGRYFREILTVASQ